MRSDNDNLLSLLTVRIQETEHSTTLGTGVIYNAPELPDNIYVLTAAHVLFEDKDNFQKPLTQVEVSFYDRKTNTYESIRVQVDSQLLFRHKDKDVAVLVIEKQLVEKITGSLPVTYAVKDRQTVKDFRVKGFPNATLGLELDSINPEWKQAMSEVDKFQLTLKEDYTDWSTEGFSGSGVFLHDHNQLYLYGIFTRFRKQEMGKVIYCQYLELINELLFTRYLPPIRFTFLGQHGFTQAFFNEHIKAAIKDLGPRFNAELNFKLPVAKLFNDLAKDEQFKKRLLEGFHKWLIKNQKRRGFSKRTHLNEVAAATIELDENVSTWVSNISWSAELPIESDHLLERIDELTALADTTRYHLYDLQLEAIKSLPANQRDNYGSKPYDPEISILREIETNNEKLTSRLADTDIKLANNRVLLIKGEAGSGKSHLLGDIATERIASGKPVILLLGQHFRKEKSVWENMISQLGLNCTFDQLLDTLNEIGRQIGSRVLILLDALNEGGGKEIWMDQLAGFLTQLKKYPHIGIAMSVRTTYWKSVIPKVVQEDPNIRVHELEGFKGNEYEALKLFCKHYKLNQPKFPILSPEFTNPLFLQLVCESLSAVGAHDFPPGFQGFHKIFGFYLKAIHKKLYERKEEYTLKTKLVKQATQAVANEAFRLEHRILPLEDAISLFERLFPAHPALLMDLIQENVFIRTMRENPDEDEESEFIYFSYERLGDFFITQQLLEPYKTKEEVIYAFQKDQALGALIQKNYWNDGVLESMAILLPEKFGLEITEVHIWCLAEQESHELWNIRASLTVWLMESLKWRSIESIDSEKILAWLQSGNYTEDDNKYFNRLIELTAVEHHFFNADRLHQILLRFNMPKRDGFWQQFLLYNHGYGSDAPYPLLRLIDWAWQPGISKFLGQETARLTAQTLVWVLSSTVKRLRDKVTKALVNLLQEQPDALIKILETFKNIDDTYLKERLYAVTYGCILRTTNKDGISKIAKWVYDEIFKAGHPPHHVMLRDYARNTIEYALAKSLINEVDTKLIRPPYQSIWPDQMPTAEDIAKFDKEGKHPPLTDEQVRIFNQIHFSSTAWDFSRKIIDPAFSDFSSERFTLEQEYKGFLKTLPVKVRAKLKVYLQFYDTRFQLTEASRRSQYVDEEKEKYREKYIALATGIMESECDIHKYLNQEQLDFVKNQVIPNIENKNRKDKFGAEGFQTEPIKNWIVKRAHELGYDIDLHYKFDEFTESYSQRFTKVERIGKKYQWIAFYEMFGIVSDHFKLRDRWDRSSKARFYHGPWENYLRNIDPAFTTRRKSDDDEESEEHDELGITPTTDLWWIDQDYTYWNQDHASWVKNVDDLPDPKRLIQRTDDSGMEWLYLNVNANWDQPTPFGKDKYKEVRKDIWLMANAYLVKKTEKQKVLKWLATQNFSGRWLPEPDQRISLINRENYWSPLSQQELKGVSPWVKIQDSSHKVMLSTAEAVGEMSEDKSGAHFNYMMPSKPIFEGMGLSYAENDGDFLNDAGESVVLNINPRGVLIRKQDFVAYLNENNLDVIWALSGEKSANGESYRESYRTSISGVYSLDNQEQINGSFKLNEDD